MNSAYKSEGVLDDVEEATLEFDNVMKQTKNDLRAALEYYQGDVSSSVLEPLITAASSKAKLKSEAARMLQEGGWAGGSAKAFTTSVAKQWLTGLEEQRTAKAKTFAAKLGMSG